GGFHRYAVDQRWLVPHFEKMLYDNAQLPRLYLDAYLLTGDAELRRIAEETLDYVLRDLRHPAGAFFSATDADSEGEEGRYFLWTPAEVAAVVGPEDAELVCAYWDITPEGNFEGRSIPHPVATPAELGARFGRSPEAAAAAIARARARLLEARAKRVPPLRDEKIIAGWNGLMIGSLAQAGLILGERRFVDAAVRAADFLWRELREGTTLLHTWAAGRARNPGYLDDHALLAAAFVDLYEATGARTRSPPRSTRASTTPRAAASSSRPTTASRSSRARSPAPTGRPPGATPPRPSSSCASIISRARTGCVPAPRKCSGSSTTRPRATPSPTPPTSRRSSCGPRARPRS